jgi:hypothetical protein
MMRIMEIQNYQKDTWRLIRKHENNPRFQLALAELYVNLPEAFGFATDLQK